MPRRANIYGVIRSVAFYLRHAVACFARRARVAFTRLQRYAAIHALFSLVREAFTIRASRQRACRHERNAKPVYLRAHADNARGAGRRRRYASICSCVFIQRASAVREARFRVKRVEAAEDPDDTFERPRRASYR